MLSYRLPMLLLLPLLLLLLLLLMMLLLLQRLCAGRSVCVRRLSPLVMMLLSAELCCYWCGCC